jgi:hypothetical protein
MLRASPDAALSITAYGGGATEAGLRMALRWWLVGIPPVVLYFTLLFRLHRGRVTAVPEGEGY